MFPEFFEFFNLNSSMDFRALGRLPALAVKSPRVEAET